MLFLQSDEPAARMRLRPLLDRLALDCRIGGYAVVDRDMRVAGDVAKRYDAILVHRNPSTRQIAWLRRTSARFVYDIDDLLPANPAATLRGRQAAEARSIAWCLTNAHCITAPSPRLLTTLEIRLGARFADRGVLILNPGAENPPPEKGFGRPRLLWVSSAVTPASDDFSSACEGIQAALRAIDTDIVLVGRFAPRVFDRLGRREHIAWLSPAQYARFLAEGPFIAVSPLPLGLSPHQQAFIDCKSDIKAAEYGSNRIEGAYSAAPPYTESDLPCLIVPTNAADDWHKSILALAGQFPTGGNALAGRAAFVSRRPSAIASRLLAALARVRDAADRPVEFRATPTPAAFRKIEQRLRKLLPRQSR